MSKVSFDVSSDDDRDRAVPTGRVLGLGVMS